MATSPLVVVVLACDDEHALLQRVQIGAERLSKALESGRPGYALLSGKEVAMRYATERFGELGAPRQFVRRTLPAENTLEQALYVAAHTRIAVERGAKIDLVTGRWHAPRAAWLFERAVGRPPDGVVEMDGERGCPGEARKMLDLEIFERMLKRRRSP